MDVTMRLARIFSDYIVLQREKPVLIFGTTESDEKVTVKLNEKIICEAEIKAGEFAFTIPSQPATENATLEIGNVVLQHVDFGEVWIAGGQSNMEFAMEFTAEWEDEKNNQNDPHLRMYTVGQYSYPEQRDEGYKAWNPWDKWLSYEDNNGARFSAVATFFAKELRNKGIPVGIISCSWGGTSGSSWLNKKLLAIDPELKAYLEDYDTLVSSLDMSAYMGAKKMMRPMMASPQGMQGMKAMMVNTVPPEEFPKAMGDMPSLPPFIDPTKISPEKFLMWGPGDQNEPGALYDNMVSEIIGITVRGVLWYQGESDCFKDKIYGKLFTAVINCWRDSWKLKNHAIDGLPFLFVQLAPYGVWGMNAPENYTIIREQQEEVSRKLSDTYMASIGDVGNVYDIHPKVKKPVGHRLALLANKYIYGNTDLLADAPEVDTANRNGDTVTITFRYAEGLYKKDTDFSSYNGFRLEQIRPEFLPDITDGINGLSVLADGIKILDVTTSIDGPSLLLKSVALKVSSEVKVEFARTGFYQINLYNRADIPVKPFTLNI